MSVDKLDRYRGCLLGGAAGDAMGYPVEFDRREEILITYGSRGVTEYVLSGGKALISDDTQMTLFTANALLWAATRQRVGAPGGTLQGATAACYQDWLWTQQEHYPLEGRDHTAWLMNVPELYYRRAPGSTCLTAIGQGAGGTIERPINHSKGCGGIMRVAPIGLWFKSPAKAGMAAAKNAAMTHGHELGYIPAGVLGYTISALTHGGTSSIRDTIQEAMSWASRQFGSSKHLLDLTTLVNRAIHLSGEDQDDANAIQTLGEGWVAEETLAIAIYCALKYEDSFDQALIAAVNHDGDSDSTGAVVGNILGAHLGLSAIPSKYLERLELKPVILELADDLCCGVPSGYGCHVPPHFHLVGTPLPGPHPETLEETLWDAKYDTASYAL